MVVVSTVVVVAAADVLLDADSCVYVLAGWPRAWSRLLAAFVTTLVSLCCPRLLHSSLGHVAHRTRSLPPLPGHRIKGYTHVALGRNISPRAQISPPVGAHTQSTLSYLALRYHHQHPPPLVFVCFKSHCSAWIAPFFFVGVSRLSPRVSM